MTGIVQRRWCGAGVFVLVAAGLQVWVVATAPALAQTRAAVNAGVQTLAERVATDRWDTFSTRITVRRAWTRRSVTPATEGAAGPALEPGIGPAIGPVIGPVVGPVVDEYVWERLKTPTGWRTRMTMVNQTAPLVQARLGTIPLPIDHGIVRMEDAEDGTVPRFFRKDGSEIVPPSPEARARLLPAGAASVMEPDVVAQATNPIAVRRAPGREWVKSFVMPASDRQRRMGQLTRTFGRRVGWARGYGQYLRHTGAQTVEWLVDEQDGVPVEVNVTEAGQLQVHTTFAYERAASGALLRRGVRVERALPGESAATTGERAVVEITYGDVQLLTTGGAR